MSGLRQASVKLSMYTRLHMTESECQAKARLLARVSMCRRLDLQAPQHARHHV